MNYNEECHKYVQSHPGKVITKQLPIQQNFSEAWLKRMVPANIIIGFKVCRIYPFNPEAVLDHDSNTPPKGKSKQNAITSDKI